MNEQPLHVCMIGSWPVIDVLEPRFVKRRYHVRKKSHPASWVRSLALALAARDDIAAVTVLVYTRETRRTCRVNDGKLTLVFIPKLEPGQTDPFHAHWFGRLRLRPWLRRLKPDIVHGFGTESANGWMAVRSGYCNVVKLQGIVAEYRKDFSWFHPRNRLLRWLESRTVAQADGLIAPSAWSYAWACRRRHADFVRMIPNVVSPEFLETQTDYSEPVCVRVGILSEIKQPQMVIRAFTAVPDPGARLVMIGEGPLRGYCERLVEDLGLAGRVVFTGRLGRADIVGHLRKARCLAIGSRVDTSPNVITEAHAMGVPVVGSDGGGIPGMVRHGEDGFIVPVDDDAAMGRYLTQLLRDPELAGRLGAAGRRRVSLAHSPERVGQAHVEWYREIIARRCR